MYSNTQRKGSNTVLERHEETVMSADNVVLMFMLVLTFVAVCQANEYISVRCDDVTGSVGKKVHFTCSVSLHTICCIRKYSFQYPKIYNDSAICRDYPVNPCKQWNSFTCRYTPTKAMTEQFRFFVNTHCGVDTTEFTVDIREPLKFEPANEAPGKKGIGIEVFVISGVSCLIIIMIIIMAVFAVKRFKSTNPSGLQNNERGVTEEQTMMTTNV